MLITIKFVGVDKLFLLVLSIALYEDEWREKNIWGRENLLGRPLDVFWQQPITAAERDYELESWDCESYYENYKVVPCTATNSTSSEGTKNC